jgi:hypothetical protein
MYHKRPLEPRYRPLEHIAQIWCPNREIRTHDRDRVNLRPLDQFCTVAAADYKIAQLFLK